MELNIIVHEGKHLKGMIEIKNDKMNFIHDTKFGGGFQHDFDQLQEETLEKIEELLVEISLKAHLVDKLIGTGEKNEENN